jgi:hypothetical protein
MARLYSCIFLFHSSCRVIGKLIRLIRVIVVDAWMNAIFDRLLTKTKIETKILAKTIKNDNEDTRNEN